MQHPGVTSQRCHATAGTPMEATSEGKDGRPEPAHSWQGWDVPRRACMKRLTRRGGGEAKHPHCKATRHPNHGSHRLATSRAPLAISTFTTTSNPAAAALCCNTAPPTCGRRGNQSKQKPFSNPCTTNVPHPGRVTAATTPATATPLRPTPVPYQRRVAQVVLLVDVGTLLRQRSHNAWLQGSTAMRKGEATTGTSQGLLGSHSDGGGEPWGTYMSVVGSTVQRGAALIVALVNAGAGLKQHQHDV
jgi:hypothetical protein